MNSSNSNENPLRSVTNLRRPDVRRVKKLLRAETRTTRGRVRKIAWKMEELLRNAGYNPNADPDADDSNGPRTVP